MDEKQLAGIAKRMHQQERQIRRLVNLLVSVLDEKFDARDRASHYIFIETKLYEYLEAGGEQRRRGE